MIRILCFSILLIFAATGPIWFLIPVACLYAFFFGGMELILVAALVDALMMPSTIFVPYYTLGSVILLVVLEFVRPYTTLHEQT